MPETTEKTLIKLKICIKPGAVSPAQKQAWQKFWEKLIGESLTRPAPAKVSVNDFTLPKDIERG